MKKRNEAGAIVVEATISLTAFMFFIMTLLMLVDICYMQAKMGTALNTTAKELSQYAYLYYKFNAHEFQTKAELASTDEKELATNTMYGIADLSNILSDGKDNVTEFDIEGLKKNIEDGKLTMESLMTMYGDAFENPKDLIYGMGALALSEGTEEIKNALGSLLAKTLMKKNLVAYGGDDADNFLRRNRVVDGLSGLNFRYTSLMAYGETNEIRLVVTYRVKVIQLLNIDFAFTFTQNAKTTAWGNGVSLITPRDETSAEYSIWNSSQMVREDFIALKEPYHESDYVGNIIYISSDEGYHIHNMKNGEGNEFIRVVSINTHEKENRTSDSIKEQMLQHTNDMIAKVSALPEGIMVKNKSLDYLPLLSDPENRTYKIKLIVPEDADKKIIEDAIVKFKKARALKKEEVEVEYRLDYGSPSIELQSEDATESPK